MENANRTNHLIQWFKGLFDVKHKYMIKPEQMVEKVNETQRMIEELECEMREVVRRGRRRDR